MYKTIDGLKNQIGKKNEDGDTELGTDVVTEKCAIMYNVSRIDRVTADSEIKK